MNKAISYPLKVIDGLADKMAAVAGAVAGCQFPQYLAQYVQCLGGKILLAKENVEHYTQIASKNSLTLDQYVSHLHNVPDSVTSNTSTEIANQIHQLSYLQNSLDSIVHSNAFTKLPNFLAHLDWSVAHQAMENYTPGIPTTMEGLGYAMIGMLAAVGIYKAGKAIVKLPFRKKEAK